MKIPLHESCRLLRADPSGLIGVEKAAGILSHPNPGKGSGQALLEVDYDSEAEAYFDGTRRWYLLNRLDAPTSGVILLADNLAMANSVKAAFASHAVEKTYAAVLKGIPPQGKDHWRDCLEVISKRGVLRTAAVRGRPNAETRIEILERSSSPPARALVALHPTTGRTHQLRVQCASRRLPIVGDATYGEFGFNREFRQRTGISRLLLHSWKTALRVEVEGRTVSFSVESPIPEVFAVALR